MENNVLISDYSVMLKIIQEIAEEDRYKYSITFNPSESEKEYEILSMCTYDDFRDAIFDGHGVLELMGFGIDGEKVPIFVLKWDDDKEEYYPVPILFDGYDFYPYEEETDELD